MASPTGRPSALSSAAVVELIQRLYPFDNVSEGSVKQLPSYEDRNFYFSGLLSHTGEDGTVEPKEYVLKIYNHINNTADVVHGVSILMEHLHAKQFSGTELVKSRQGGSIATITERELCGCAVKGTAEDTPELEVDKVKGTNTYWVRVIRFLPGELLGSIRKECVSTHLLYDVGHYLGRMDTALQEEIDNTALCSRVLANYNLMRFQTVYRNFISSIEDPRRRRMAKEVFTSFRDHVAPHIPSFKQGIIYNDANSSNIVLRPTSQDEYAVAGFIDYDDAVYSCYVFDLGTLLAHMFIENIYPVGCLDPVGFMAPLISGYNQAFPLSQVEMKCLFSVVMARCCQLGMVSGVCYKNEQWNSHIAVYVDSSWRAMELLLSVSKPEIDRMWGGAVGKTLDDYNSA